MAANDVPCCEPMFWTYLIICIALVCFAGLMSGLTLGLMSLSLVDLEVLIKAGQPQERKHAEKILPIVKNQHLLLCTLLIGNALAMEIIPQAVCSRYGLSVGAKMSVVVRLIVVVLFPLAYPISKLLDWILGKKHSALLRRAELKTLVDMLGSEAGKGGELTHDETTIITGALDMTQKTAKDAMTPLSKVFSLDINSKLDEETLGLIINKGHSRIPIYSGNLENIIGLILVKNLIKFRPEDETPIREITIRKIPRVQDHLPLYDIMNQFQIGHSHMAVVVKCKHDVDGTAEVTKSTPSMFKTNRNRNPKQRKEDVKGNGHQPGRNEHFNICIHKPSVSEYENPRPSNVTDLADCLHPKLQRSECENQSLSNEDECAAFDEEVIGIITLEDVMEELLQEEILDETDEYIEAHTTITINMLPSRRSPLIKSPLAAAAASQIQWRTPLASPVSSYHQSPLSSCNLTPLLHSPIPAYVRSPLARPTLSASPEKSVPNSPPGTANYSPSSRQVSRKSYDKLRA
ncbi:DUF21 domain-containing protein At5g52790 isoform X2 [Ricinus communis]|uniref:DUF21 domain-containing protein At5g52790 isoform X2 n=1 Tax=Ricinus communis TaxID=3988 RepID=UPI0007724C6F|nr:DUF21 domain-containing protein At5g52790 isoform X2 [Ricinus communis]|eukprot:XP_015571088.1 DUF21 domain-containing protein At5g52790 isoform X2 [Ricinus communis]